MPGPKLTASRGDEKREFAGDDAELLRAAVEKGWTIDGHTVVAHPEKGMRAVPSDRADLIEAATSKGWSVAGAAPDPDRWSVNLEGVDQAAYQRSDAARSEERLQRELAEQRARELQERQFGVGYDAWAADPANAAENLVRTAGEGLGRGPVLGFDAPMAAAQATVDQIQAYTADSPGVEFTPHRGVTPGGEQPAVTWGDRFDAAMGGIQTRKETNPVTAFTSEVVGATAPVLAAGPMGGNSFLARLAANAPTGRIASAAARLGVRAATPLAAMAEAPGLAGSLARIGAPALALGVEGGVQGAAQGAGAAANELWQNGDDNTAWQYITGAGEGALLGFGLGAGVGSTLGTIRGVRANKRGPVALRELGLLPEATPDLPARTASDQLAGQYPVPEAPTGATAAARKVVNLTPDAAKKVRDELYPQLEAEFNEFLQLRQHLDEVLDLKAKRAFAMKHGTTPLGKWSPEQIRGQSGLPTTAEIEALAEMGAIKFDGKGSGALLKRFASQLDAIEKELLDTAAERPLTEGDLFMAFDQQKRAAQKVSSRANDTGQAFLFDTFDPKVKELQAGLENGAIDPATGEAIEFWSPALAQMQRETNGSWSPAIAAGQDSSLRPMLGQVGTHATWNPYEMPNKVNGNWLYGHMGNIGVLPPEAQTEAALNRFLNANADDVVTRARVYGSDEMQAMAKRSNELRRSMQMQLGQTSELNRSVSAAPDYAKALGMLSQVPGSTYVAEAVADRARDAAYKATVKTVQEVDSAAQLKGLVLGAKPANDVTIGVASAPGVARASANPREVAEYVERLVAGDPRRDDVVARLEQTVSPGLGKAALAALEQQRAFLMEKVGDPKDPQSEQRLLEYGSAMLRPLDALKRIGAGVATPADRETVQQLYPALWERFVRGGLKRLAKSDATYDDRVRASRALGIPLDPSLAPDRYRALQQAATQSMMQPPQTQAAPDVAQLYQRQQ